jgi:hypothetical protein
MADQGSLADVVERAADGASVRTLVICTLVGLVALVATVLWLLFGGHGQWQLPFAAGAVSSVAFGIGGLAHQRLQEEQAVPESDPSHLATLRVVQGGSIIAGAAGAIVLAGRVLMALYGSSFWN